MKRERCSVDGCARQHYARGWCHAHYMRIQRTGEPVRSGYCRFYVLTNEGRRAAGLPLRWAEIPL